MLGFLRKLLNRRPVNATLGKPQSNTQATVEFRTAPPPAGPASMPGRTPPEMRATGTRKKGSPQIQESGKVSSYPWKSRPQ
jgi:hypothetical protein